MRIAKLHLVAYGPFRGVELDLSAPGLHVVFGRNEAGKSTTLRAISALLYGIEPRTVDAHAHKPQELRVGGTLVGEDGTRLAVVRRKGVSKGGPNTLLDAAGQALDEARLQRLLGGVAEETFRSAFGLDLDRLHQGARALLLGGGDIGGSLFDASSGGADARALLARLSDEADRLYKPRATTPTLNAALKAFAEAQQVVRERQSLPEAYTKQREALEEARAGRAELDARRAGLALRRLRLARATKRAPLASRRARLVAQLASLGDVARSAPRVMSLHARLGAYERASSAHEAERAEVARLTELASSAARRLEAPGVARGQAAAPSPRVEPRVEARILRLLQERTTVRERIDLLRVELARDERALARLSAATVTPKPHDAAEVSALSRAVTRARSLEGTVARHAADAQKVARRRSDLTSKAAALGRFRGTLEQLVGLRLPAAGALDDLVARAADLERAVARCADRVEHLGGQLLVVEQQLAEASGEFAPPTKAELQAARAARDEAWARVRGARGATAETALGLAALDSAFERAAREADVLADRMILEADRVTMLARLRAQKATLSQQQKGADAELEEAQARRAALDDEHRRLWQGVIGSPDSAAEVDAGGLAAMRAWREGHAALVEAYAALREAELVIADAEAELAAARDELLRALPAASTTATARPLRLLELLDRACAVLAQVEEARRAADEAARSHGTLAPQVEARRAALARDDAALAEVTAGLAPLLSSLGIADDASAEEVRQALEAQRELFALEEQRASASARAASAADEARAFHEEVQRLAAELAPDLADLPPRDVVSALAERARAAIAAESSLAETDAELGQLGDEPVAEDLAPLVADADLAARASEDLETELSELERELTSATTRIGGLENGLVQLGVESGAAEAAAQAEAALARVRAGAERFARARVGALILAREIERYREENQGPTLALASRLFAQLTLGSFRGVRAGYSDKDRPALLCVRAEGGTEVDVEGLSEGTRDQLYLSLRLASLFRFAELKEPMPLVLDDVLVQFDDERARAAMVVLSELSARMQVLFFTHHARLVELARAAVGPTALTVHDLSSASASATASRRGELDGPLG